MALDPSPLAGKVALVTGGARGIGRAICLALAEAGADVAVADAHPEPFDGEQYYRMRRRVSGPEEQTATWEAAAALGVRSTVVQMNVAEEASVRAGVASVVAELGPIDVLVNNAGIVNNIATITDMTAEAWQHELAVNLTGAFNTVRAIVPAMAERGWGRVVNMSSIAALRPGAGQPGYAASKAGLVAFTQAVAQEYGRGGVTANAVMPGLIGTPLVLSMPEHLRNAGVRQSAVGRLGEPADIANLVRFLALPASGFITGVAIACDGGTSFAPPNGLNR